jgi:hypothetical protein
MFVVVTDNPITLAHEYIVHLSSSFPLVVICPNLTFTSDYFKYCGSKKGHLLLAISSPPNMRQSDHFPSNISSSPYTLQP